jgi:hypothetical protein
VIHVTRLVGRRWTTPTPVPFTDPRWGDSDPTLTPDGRTLYFVSDRPAAGADGRDSTRRDLDVWRVRREATPDGERWGTPERLGPEVNTRNQELGPTWRDGVLYFASARRRGIGGLDLWAARDLGDGRFAPAALFGGALNTPASESDPELSPDGRTLLFWSDRPGAPAAPTCTPAGAFPTADGPPRCRCAAPSTPPGSTSRPATRPTGGGCTSPATAHFGPSAAALPRPRRRRRRRPQARVPRSCGGCVRRPCYRECRRRRSDGAPSRRRWSARRIRGADGARERRRPRGESPRATGDRRPVACDVRSCRALAVVAVSTPVVPAVGRGRRRCSARAPARSWRESGRIVARGPSRAPRWAMFANHTSDDHTPEGVPPGRDGRTFAVAGVTWTVTERDGVGVPGNADGARGRRCLVFASPEVIRRVWDYPPDWRTLPDAALLALSWRR